MLRTTLADPDNEGKPPSGGTPTQPERRGVGRRTVIEAAKEKVATKDLADILCGQAKLQRIGEEWVARCPLPEHEDKTPSFTVNPVKNLWFCHGCLRGGDVVELARFAWGYRWADELAMLTAPSTHTLVERLGWRLGTFADVAVAR